MDPTSERAARARTIFRAGNEALVRAAGSRGDAIPFICECADETCLRRVPLTRAEYAEARTGGDAVVVPGHEGGER